MGCWRAGPEELWLDGGWPGRVGVREEMERAAVGHGGRRGSERVALHELRLTGLVTHGRPPFRFSQAITSLKMKRRLLPMKTQGIPSAWRLSMVRRLQSNFAASALRRSRASWSADGSLMDSTESSRVSRWGPGLVRHVLDMLVTRTKKPRSGRGLPRAR